MVNIDKLKEASNIYGKFMSCSGVDCSECPLDELAKKLEDDANETNCYKAYIQLKEIHKKQLKQIGENND